MTLEDIVRKLSSVKDNLWLGDIEEVKIMVGELSTQESRQEENRHLKAREIFKETYKGITDEVKNKFSTDVDNREIAKQNLKQKKSSTNQINFEKSTIFQKIVLDKGLSPKDAIVGSVVEYLSSLQTKYRKTKTTFEIYKKPGLKYSLIVQGDKFESRILMANEALDFKDLCNNISDLGFEVSLNDTLEVYKSVRAFSNQAYLEIAFFPPRIEMRVTLLSNKLENAKELSDKIVSSLMSSQPK